jgi:hypothetical protein
MEEKLRIARICGNPPSRKVQLIGVKNVRKIKDRSRGVTILRIKAIRIPFFIIFTFFLNPVNSPFT